MPKLQYRSPSMAQEFSQHTLTNIGYFWDENGRVYYFSVIKNGREIYNLDDPTEFVDAAVEPHVVVNQPIGASHGVPQGDALMQVSYPKFALPFLIFTWLMMVNLSAYSCHIHSFIIVFFK